MPLDRDELIARITEARLLLADVVFNHTVGCPTLSEDDTYMMPPCNCGAAAKNARIYEARKRLKL